LMMLFGDTLPFIVHQSELPLCGTIALVG